VGQGSLEHAVARDWPAEHGLEAHEILQIAERSPIATRLTEQHLDQAVYREHLSDSGRGCRYVLAAKPYRDQGSPPSAPHDDRRIRDGRDLRALIVRIA